MRKLGGKSAAKDIAVCAGVPVVPGYHGSRQDAATLIETPKVSGEDSPADGIRNQMMQSKPYGARGRVEGGDIRRDSHSADVNIQ